MCKPYIFISYSRKNAEIVKKICEEFGNLGQDVFIDKSGILPGETYAEKIVDTIEGCSAVVLMLSNASNVSKMVLREINIAVNNDKIITPLIIEPVSSLSKTLQFYLGCYNFVEYVDSETLRSIIKTINNVKKDAPHNDFKYKKPVVLSTEEVDEIGYNTKKRVIETIEIDYRTLGESPVEFDIDNNIEGDPESWVDYANQFPETCSFLVCKDKIVGYYQIELINEDNYKKVISGTEMIQSGMQESYIFGGDFYCYIAIMPIIYEYETQQNYKLLIDDLFKKLVHLINDNFVNIKGIAISVYSKYLECIVKQLGFVFLNMNLAKGKIYQLDLTKINENKIIKQQYYEFYKIYGEK